MPLLNNFLANSPSFLGGITPGQSTGTVEPQKSSPVQSAKNEAFGGGGFGPPQGGGGFGGLFGETGMNTPWYESSFITGGNPNMFNRPHMPTENTEPAVAPPMAAPPAQPPMMPPPSPPTGVSPMFNAPQYSPPPGANSPAVAQATPEIMKFANPQTSPNFGANAMPIYNR